MTTRRHGSPAEAASGSLAQQVRRRAVALLWTVRSAANVDRSTDPADTALVLGSARSGTTWVGEVLDRHRDYRVLFEPLRPGAVPAMAPFDGVRYLRPSVPAPGQEAAMRSLLSGRIRNSWVDHTNRRVISRRRLVKEIRANCLTPWLAATFPMCAMVIVVRHPLAVTASRLSLGWADHLDEFARIPELRADLGPAADALDGLTDPVVRSVASWAVETAVPLRSLGPRQAAIVTYEDLRRDPLTAYGPVVAQVGQQMDDALERAVGRQSRTSRPGGDYSRSGAGWATRLDLDLDQRARIADLLKTFALDGLYDVDDPHPSATGLTEARSAATERPDESSALMRAAPVDLQPKDGAQ